MMPEREIPLRESERDPTALGAYLAVRDEGGRLEEHIAIRKKEPNCCGRRMEVE